MQSGGWHRRIRKRTEVANVLKPQLRNFPAWTLYLVLILMIAVLITMLGGLPKVDKEVYYNDFIKQVKEDKVGDLVYARQDTKLYGLYKETQFTAKDLPRKYDFFVYTEENTLRRDLNALTAVKSGSQPDLVSTDEYPIATFRYYKLVTMSVGDFVPYLLLLGAFAFLWFMVMRQQSGNTMSTFAKSKARIVTNDTAKVTFADVAGADEEKEELAEIVEFLRSPQRFTAMGARIPKGVILMGPPGTGKTLLAKAVAGEAGVPFYSISGSDFVEMYVGVGASRVRDLFTTAKKTAPAIIFIDEIDAVGRHRGAGLGGGHDEREQTLNQLLVEMDGFDPHAGIIVIAATNRPDILDPALLRPGRFDRQVVVNRPDVKGREEILKVHSKKKPLGPEIDLKVIAQRTPGFTGADLENVLNEAAILTVRNSKDKIGRHEVEEAITRVIAGPEKKSRVISERDKRITAVHEAGHAIAARALEHADPVHEISIIQRGQAAGYTMTLPEDEMQHYTKAKLLDDIVMLMGGRVAEAVYIGDISTGASNDIQRATDIAHRMVTEFGMSDRIGPRFLGSEQEVFLGKDLGHSRSYSEEVAGIIDEEVSSLIDNAYKRAETILREQKASVELVADVLVEHERLDGFQFDCLCQKAEGKRDESIEEILAMKAPEKDGEGNDEQ